ncbi:aminoglycoside phosphotransferase family protein [Paenibacillus sp. N3.4]|uniref:aminoglycoside phosphotransferase family protein n=1 Tax=Paenibacillus sp. N3.4 TaxID=2603222 RepID=UPI0011C9A661|nr:aminoglycoside phosphotransferase family protein [Paenibacillus sp. N3.4]TXK85020.1 hydrogenase expression protein HypB [Paenibacillus sp. N3.4]
MVHLPKQFVHTLKEIHKEKAESWLDTFDQFLVECEKRWDMEIMPHFDLSYHFVAPARLKDGTEIVVKLAVPNKEFNAEVEALTLFNGKGMVKIIDVDLAKGILILERLLPGETLASLDSDEEATLIAAQVMKNLWIPAPFSSGIPTALQREKNLEDIVKLCEDSLGPITKEILQEALGIFQEMNKMPATPYLLHGDLHHYNILSADREREPWLAIDPKGLIGDKEYDVIQFLLNKLPNENAAHVIEKRIDILVEELNLDKKKVLLWGFSHAVLATCWTIGEDGHYNEAFFKTIDVFKNLRSGIA